MVVRILAGVVLSLLFTSCFGHALPSDRIAGPTILAINGGLTSDNATLVKPSTSAVPDVVDSASVVVRGFHEPGDYAHRNYCGAGAIEVLLSGWLYATPDIETVAKAAQLNPRRGVSGADSVVAINGFLRPIVEPELGNDWYRGEHVVTLDDLEARLRSDLPNPDAIQLFGHGVPVIVSTMTKTMPGWRGWNATHMITIFAFDLSHHDPELDTVTYAETPSPVAGYRGPDFQTITLQALWTAMQAYTVQAPWDPINVIW